MGRGGGEREKSIKCPLSSISKTDRKQKCRSQKRFWSTYLCSIKPAFCCKSTCLHSCKEVASFTWGPTEVQAPSTRLTRPTEAPLCPLPNQSASSFSQAWFRLSSCEQAPLPQLGTHAHLQVEEEIFKRRLVQEESCRSMQSRGRSQGRPHRKEKVSDNWKITH